MKRNDISIEEPEEINKINEINEINKINRINEIKEGKQVNEPPFQRKLELDDIQPISLVEDSICESIPGSTVWEFLINHH